jgi:hypothetical protein
MYNELTGKQKAEPYERGRDNHWGGGIRSHLKT